ncbi:hypothetical protein [Zoogloea sp.]|uniref:hypothetical protein n=1 Tax=Zoogloea sp. TaxID=49181 RepID=UPI0035B34C11
MIGSHRIKADRLHNQSITNTRTYLIRIRKPHEPWQIRMQHKAQGIISLNTRIRIHTNEILTFTTEIRVVQSISLISPFTRVNLISLRIVQMHNQPFQAGLIPVHAQQISRAKREMVHITLKLLAIPQTPTDLCDITPITGNCIQCKIWIQIIRTLKVIVAFMLINLSSLPAPSQITENRQSITEILYPRCQKNAWHSIP